MPLKAGTSTANDFRPTPRPLFGVSLAVLCLLLLWLDCSAQAPGDERWDVRFGLPGTDNAVLCAAGRGTDLYIGGTFSFAGARNANLVAKWDGTDWSGLGSGVAGVTNGSEILSMVFKGADLYVGGFFTNAGGAVARGVAKWDGTNWSALPGGFNGLAVKLAVNGNDLYVAGTFVLGNDTNTYGFAKFDGSSWNTFGSTLSGCVGLFCTPAAGAILIDGPDIYVGGSFTNFAGLPANSIVRWDGAQWNPLSTGLTGTNVFVTGLAKYGGQLIAGGGFTSAGGQVASNLAGWDGANWSALGNPNNTLRPTLSDGTYLYVAGDFTQIGGVAAARVARWDGLNWSALGPGVNSTVFGLARNQTGDLIAAGTFTSAGNIGAANIARWDGNSWSNLGGNLGNGMNRDTGFVRALHVAGGVVYAGGNFSTAGEQLAKRVAQWNGSAWSALGAGIIGPVTHQVSAIAHIGSDIYCGGFFTNAGNLNASIIARWDGFAWSALGGSVNSNVSALAVNGGELYVGGAFTMAGTLAANHIAKWSGAAWLPLGAGMNSNVNVLAAGSNGDVYAGGVFTIADGTSANKVARWNNATGWTPLGNGINSGTVTTLAVDGSNVYVAGNFSLADSLPVNNIARWNGVSWSALGSGLKMGTSSAQVAALVVRGSELYAGGNITNAGGVRVQGIARWDGTNWSALGSSLSRSPASAAALALAVSGDSLWLGGIFLRAGSKPSVNFARWLLNPPSLQLTDVSRPPGGPLHFRSTGLLGLKLRVDASNDLNRWDPLTHLNAYGDSYDFMVDTSLDPLHAFRLVAEP